MKDLKLPEITNYVELKNSVIEALRKQLEKEMKLKYKNKLVLVDKEMNVWVHK